MTSLPAALLDAPLRGVQRPRISSIPPYTYSAGPDAVALAASAGLHLDDWQRWVLTNALGEREVDGNWSAFEVGLIVPRQNGKGSILEARELYGLVAVEEERLIVHSAHLFKTAKEAFHRILRLLQSTDDLKRKIKKVTWTRGDEGIEMVDGSRLNFVARSKGGGRGLSGDCLILDEAFALTDDHIEALMPIMSARDNGQIWYTSSPPLDAITGEVLFGVKARGEAGDPVLAWFDWGADRDADIDDREVWARTNPALGIRISEEAVEREHRTMKPEGFGRERLGIWPATAGTAVISAEQWQALADPDSRVGGEVAFAVDAQWNRGVSSIAAYSVRPDGLGHVELVAQGPGTAWVVPWLTTRVKKYRPVAIAIDAKGPAGSLLAELEKVGITVPADLDAPERGDLAVPASADDTAAVGQFLDAVTDGTLRHFDQPELNMAIDAARTKPRGDAQVWTRRTASSDISPLVAATLARWAYVTRAEKVCEEADPGAWVL